MSPRKSVKLNPESNEVVLYFRELKRLFNEQHPDPTLTDYVNEIKCVKKLLYGEDIGDEKFYHSWIKRFDMTSQEASKLKVYHVLHQKSILYEYEYFPPKDVKTDITERHSHVYAYAFQEYLMHLYSEKNLKLDNDSDFTDQSEYKQTLIDPNTESNYDITTHKVYNQKFSITDKVLMELLIIDKIFRAQLSKYHPDTFTDFPIMDGKGNKGIDGCYFSFIYIYSQIELFNLHDFKADITKRFETALRPSLLINQLIKIKKIAAIILTYYYTHLGPDTEMFKKFYAHFFAPKEDKKDEENDDGFIMNTATVLISSSLNLNTIFIGSYAKSQNIVRVVKSFEIGYSQNNFSLVNFCKEIFEFIDSIDLVNYTAKPGNSESDHNSEPDIDKLTLRQIALLCFYKGRRVTRENGNEIAKEYGLNSGEKLFQHYSFYLSRQNRIAKEPTHKKSLNKISLIESVIDLLPHDSPEKQRASEELNTLKAAVAKED
ncbi:MAG: hypothetical protein M0R16_10385 [Bacteroidales bacterium]|jgi:hypothetical protein|nr:hypothetical protein [Bacteroidales bacterium]